MSLLSLGIIASSWHESWQPEPPRSDEFLWPYVASSAWNRPIGSGAQYSAEGSEITNNIRQTFSMNCNYNNGWGVASRKTTSSETLRTVTYNPIEGGNPDQFPVTLRYGSQFPAAAAGDAEGAAIWDTTADGGNGSLHEFFHLPWNGGSPKSYIHYCSRLPGAGEGAWGSMVKLELHLRTGKGHSDVMSERVGVTAAGMSVFAGVWQKEELDAAAEGVPLRRCHNIVLAYENYAQGLIWWPGSVWDGWGTNTGVIPYGARITIKPQSQGGPNLDTLVGSSGLVRMIANSILYFGLLAVDRAGNQFQVVRADERITAAQATTILEAYTTTRPYWVVVTNDNKDLTFAGGGTAPIGPYGLAPPFA